MDEKQQSGTYSRANDMQDEVKVVDLLIVLAKHKRLLLGLPIVGAVLAAVVAMILPPVYRANATLLPPQSSTSAAGALLSQLGGAATLLSGAAGIKNPSDVYIGMLKSRTVSDKLVKRFDLLKAYETESPEKARMRLSGNTNVTADKSGLIIIEVDDRNRERSAQIANAYVEELMNLTKVLAVTDAAQRRLFFERQLAQAKNNLASAEMHLKQVLDAHGMVSVDVQTQALLTTVAQLRAKIAAKEIELNSMQAFITPNNVEYKRTEEELRSLKAQLNQMENGRSDGARNQTPGGLENIQALRDVKYFQMLYELLAKQYEVARLDEASNSSVIQVLDMAVVPEMRAAPKRTVIVLISTVLALVVAVVVAFIKEGLERVRRNAGGNGDWEKLAAHLRFRKTAHQK
ncbi:Wzz/FepE/Etk N-terminal domain-containing protein [Massilia sp. CT11-137]|uniref:Wzz/FepE/Etk N-terminal domain-containing protein n=1 Tax=Massilia sp. CT11-137 TaxID=3393901 RepID=UPI0039A5DFCA